MCEPPANIFAWRPQKANYCDGPGLFWTDKLTLGMANCVFFSSFSIYNFRSDQVWHLPRSSNFKLQISASVLFFFFPASGSPRAGAPWCSTMASKSTCHRSLWPAPMGPNHRIHGHVTIYHLGDGCIAVWRGDYSRQGVFKGLQTPRLKRWGAEARDFECNSLGYWCDTTLVHPFSRNPSAPQCSGLMYNLNNWKFPLRMMLFQSLDIIGGLSPGHKFKWKLFGVTQPNHDGIHISAFCVPISLGYSI